MKPLLVAGTIAALLLTACLTALADDHRVRWSDLEWDEEARQHYYDVANKCDHDHYCYVKVTRDGKTTTYGWNVPGGGDHRIHIGIAKEEDKIEKGWR